MLPNLPILPTNHQLRQVPDNETLLEGLFNNLAHQRVSIDSCFQQKESVIFSLTAQRQHEGI